MMSSSLLNLIIISLSILLPIVFALVWILYPVRRMGKKKDALLILEERYARGEISREEYLRMKKYLER